MKFVIIFASILAISAAVPVSQYLVPSAVQYHKSSTHLVPVKTVVHSSVHGLAHSAPLALPHGLHGGLVAAPAPFYGNAYGLNHGLANSAHLAVPLTHGLHGGLGLGVHGLHGVHGVHGLY